jgi:prepilin-type N-terminal cleavage/methylation domain-containing protein
MNARRAASGFTLIEMVIAFAILGLSLSALYATFQNALSRTGHDVRLTEATLLARSLLARAGTEWPLIEGSLRGEWNEYAYELSEHKTVAPANEVPFTLPTVQVTATVTWVEFAGKRSYSLSTLKLQPWVAP